MQKNYELLSLHFSRRFPEEIHRRGEKLPHVVKGTRIGQFNETYVLIPVYSEAKLAFAVASLGPPDRTMAALTSGRIVD